MQKNQKGFGLIEILLLMVLAGIIIGSGYYVIQANKGANKSLSEASNAETITKQDNLINEANKEEVVYCDESTGGCITYDSSWNTEKLEADGSPSPTLQLTRNNIKLVYAPYVDGIGGHCEPTTCFAEALEITKLSGGGDNSLIQAVGSYIEEGMEKYYPIVAVTENSTIEEAKLLVGKKVDTEALFLLYRVPDMERIGFLHAKFPERYQSRQEALDVLSSDTVKEASIILSSLKF